jgi:hypothetical protein
MTFQGKFSSFYTLIWRQVQANPFICRKKLKENYLFLICLCATIINVTHVDTNKIPAGQGWELDFVELVDFSLILICLCATIINVTHVDTNKLPMGQGWELDFVELEDFSKTKALKIYWFNGTTYRSKIESEFDIKML